MNDLFGVERPIIAMCHLQPLPGDPHYDAAGGMRKVIDCARSDLLALQEGGVDGVMFSNEFSMPYVTHVDPVTVASMARIIGELMPEISIPYGVNCIWDAVASIDLAAAVDAKFIREIISGVYASDFGLWNTDPGATARHRMAVGAGGVRMLYNIVPEAAKYLADRDIASIARSTEFNLEPDALCVSGLTAGAETDTQVLVAAKNAVVHTPVLCNTGCNVSNVERQLSVADGAVCATTFKVDGVFENAVDVNRVKEFMAKVREVRAAL